MRDTVWSIILTQTPIALACALVWWEIRGVRKALERIAQTTRELRDEAKRPD